MWYTVLLDAEGSQHQAIQYDHEPTEQEWQEDAQTVGYYYSGIFVALCGDDAIRQAESSFDGSGCVA